MKTFNLFFCAIFLLPFQKTLQAQVVAPATIVSRAEDYKNEEWTLNSGNYTTGVYKTYNCPAQPTYNEKWVVSPTWVSPGSGASKTGLPYKWGGNISLSSFLSSVASGIIAGDKITNSSGYLCGVHNNYAVGLDCSGLVSRCWGSIALTTASIPNHSQKLDSYSELRPGDVINTSGHTRLFKSQNPTGTFNFIEAVNGGIGKVRGVSYDGSTLGAITTTGGYLPMRYNYANDEPCNPLPIPVKSTCTYVTNVGNGGATHTSSASVPNPSCGAYTASNKDVWYRFTVPTTNNYRVQVQTGTLTALGFAIYQGGCFTSSNSLTQIPGKCTTVSGSGTTGVITGTSTSGYWLYVRVWGTSTTTGTFKICVKNSLTREDVEAEAIASNDLSLYPNPTSGHFTFECADEFNSSGVLEIFNPLGQSVYYKTLINTGGLFLEPCDLSGLANGVYFIRFNAGKSWHSRKITINR